MKNMKLMIGLAALLSGMAVCSAQTVIVTNPAPGSVQATATPPAGNWAVKLWNDGRAFLTDNTNIFNSGSVLAEVGPVLNLSDLTWGADADIEFPVAQQASVGFDLFYYNNKFYDGTCNTTLGKTWTVPIIGPVYTYGRVGLGTDLQNPTEVINAEWAGAKWQYTIHQWGTGPTSASLNVTGKVAAGHVSGVTGTLVEGLFGLQLVY
jgi:hypothetical protein